MPDPKKHIAPFVTSDPEEEKKFKANYLKRQSDAVSKNSIEDIDDDYSNSVDLTQMSPDLINKIRSYREEIDQENMNVNNIASKFQKLPDAPVIDPFNPNRNMTPHQNRVMKLSRDVSDYNVKDYIAGISEPGLEQSYPVEEALFMMIATPAGRSALNAGKGLVNVGAKETISASQKLFNESLSKAKSREYVLGKNRFLHTDDSFGKMLPGKDWGDNKGPKLFKEYKDGGLLDL